MLSLRKGRYLLSTRRSSGSCSIDLEKIATCKRKFVCKKRHSLPVGLWTANLYFQMVDLSISDGKLILHVRGTDKLWALKSSLEIPLEHVSGIRADPSVAQGWYHGIRFPGTSIPGVITAGTFYQHNQRIFWDVHNPDNTVVIELKDERYNELIVEVADPVGTVGIVKSMLPQH